MVAWMLSLKGRLPMHIKGTAGDVSNIFDSKGGIKQYDDGLVRCPPASVNDLA